MSFNSILFKEKEDFDNSAKEPDFFSDLNLNIVVSEITSEKRRYALEPFFYQKLNKKSNIVYRQNVLRDIEKEEVFEVVKEFAASIISVRDGLDKALKLSCEYQKQRWFLDSVFLYCESVVELNSSLDKISLESEGLLNFLKYAKTYINSDNFKEMYEHTKRLKKSLDDIIYSIFIKENKIRVENYKDEEDYSKEILKVFERFRQGEVEDYVAEFHETEYMNHIESGILKFVAKLNSDVFDDLKNFCDKYENFFDKTIDLFDREVQFYVSFLEYIRPMEDVGLKFCYPNVSKDKNIYNYEGFDIALASKLEKQEETTVTNDFYLKDNERIFIVTGPNQGGKTTFARAFGQMHYLACLGLKIPGSKASLFLFDNIFTHFEKEENIETLSGKLEDDLVRIRKILEELSPDSIVIMNEIFSSTTLHDAVFLAKKVLEEIITRDSICVFVTFLDELADLSPKIVSMMSTVKPDDTTVRTYKILRKQADGAAYAVSIAKKYSLTYECLKNRLNGAKT